MTGSSNSKFFIIGGVGSIINAALTVLIFLTLLAYYLGLVGMEQWEEWPLSIVSFFAGVLLAIGVVLAGVGYLGLRRNYRSAMGTASFALGIVACVFLILLSVVEITRVFVDPKPPDLYTWSEFEVIVAVVTYILFGVSQIVWGVTHVVTRRFVNSGLSLATGILLIISGALTATSFLYAAGAILFFVAEVMVTTLFFRPKAPAMQP